MYNNRPNINTSPTAIIVYKKLLIQRSKVNPQKSDITNSRLQSNNFSNLNIRIKLVKFSLYALGITLLILISLKLPILGIIRFLGIDHTYAYILYLITSGLCPCIFYKVKQELKFLPALSYKGYIALFSFSLIIIIFFGWFIWMFIYGFIYFAYFNNSYLNPL